MAALARAEFGRGQLQQRQELLGQIASVLKQQAERLHLAVFVTNQVTTRIGAAAGHDTGPGAGREEGDGGGIGGGGGGAERDAGSRDAGSGSGSGAFYTLVPIRPRWRGERRSLRTFAVVSPPTPRFQSPTATPLNAH